MQDALGKIDSATQSAREDFHPILATVGQADKFKDLADALLQRRPAHPVQMAVVS